VDKAIRQEERSVARERCLEAIRAVLAMTSIARIRRPTGFVTAKLDSLGRNHAARLADALRNLSPEPARRELHRLRLLVKSLRYQDEMVRGTIWADSRRLSALKRLQKTVGDYCDLYQFRRLAKKLDLRCRSQIKKKYRRARARARAAVRKLRPPVSPA
jgi:CHAD domain-containing protein